MDIKLLQELSLTNRVLSLEERASDSVIKGDFQGSVTGYWKKLGERGEGIVSYKDKDYKQAYWFCVLAGWNRG